MTNYNERVDDELRMDAYYYSFSPTGNINIDRILSAVATAGKHYHHTQEWQEGGEQEAIQKAANDAAQAITSLIKELALEARIDELSRLPIRIIARYQLSNQNGVLDGDVAHRIAELKAQQEEVK